MTPAAARVMRNTYGFPAIVGALRSGSYTLAFDRGDVTGDMAGILRCLGVNFSIIGHVAGTSFKGNGTAACPAFTQPDDFVVDLFQVAPLRITSRFWFKTLDIRNEAGTLLITGLNA